jgi:hypothetical protein
LLRVMPRRAAELLALAMLPVACHSSSTPPTLSPQAAASAPVPGVTLPPGPLVNLVPNPNEVPAGMEPVEKGSGPRDLSVVASYSGTGSVDTKAAATLRRHGFQSAYVAQYANLSTGQVVSAVVSQFATVAGATADFRDDLASMRGTAVVAPTVGDGSAIITEPVPGKVPGELVLLRFRRGADTWVIGYEAAPTADPSVVVGLAQHILARNAL